MDTPLNSLDRGEKSWLIKAAPQCTSVHEERKCINRGFAALYGEI